MKSIFPIIALAGLIQLTPAHTKAQSFELQQLILNLEKLNQLRAILDHMKKGYEILTIGYNTVKDLSQGNFSLHKTFLDALMEVSPTVKKYKRIADIIALQKALIKEYKAAFALIRTSKVYSDKELEHIGQVYQNLVDKSLDNMEELLMVVTAGKLRMNDAERLNAIDRIYLALHDKVDFLRSFNNTTSTLTIQRKQELHDIETLQQLQGFK